MSGDRVVYPTAPTRNNGASLRDQSKEERVAAINFRAVMRAVNRGGTLSVKGNRVFHNDRSDNRDNRADTSNFEVQRKSDNSRNRDSNYNDNRGGRSSNNNAGTSRPDRQDVNNSGRQGQGSRGRGQARGRGYQQRGWQQRR
ncbi:DEAD-box ATP-dependent RNA helicase CshA-like [Ruditapes philippinarum]|uniref:DEAD-box ATP-dependent RNA helicase CshA-like n=1 Tax=Ruditapes philippinarum TaxID=129788 RepID=UPI00295B31F7|nr:DEAD-box ATP-dependent RNA helicase CshA-like [Ruditapes philippinarum]